MARIQIKVNNKELKRFDSFAYNDQLNTVSASASFNTFVDFEDFGYSDIQIFRNEVLILTGDIINKIIPDGIPAKPFTYKCESKPYALKSSLPTTAYSLQLENSTLKDIVEYICSFLDVTVVFDQSAEKEAKSAYKLTDLKLAVDAIDIINELVTNEGLIMSHNADGHLVITKSIEQNEILLPRHTDNNKSYDLKKLFHNYIALGQAPIGADADIQAIARFENIKATRSTTKIQNSGGIAAIEAKAAGMRADSLRAIQQTLTYDNFFCNVGDFIVLNDLKLIVNQLNYSFNSKGEKASIGVIDSNIYTR
jgi:hypothetical protein